MEKITQPNTARLEFANAVHAAIRFKMIGQQQESEELLENTRLVKIQRKLKQSIRKKRIRKKWGK